MQFKIQDNRKVSQESNPISEGAGHSLVDRAASFGDGFFTTGRIIDGKIDALTHHINRIQRSLERLKFTPSNSNPVTAAVKHAGSLSDAKLINQSIVEQLKNACLNINRAGFRLSVSRQQDARGYAVSPQSVIHANLQLFDLPKQALNYCQLIIAETPVSVNPYLAGIKHLNRLDNVLAASEINQPQQEALMFNQDELISASRSNIFLKINSKWLTPLLDNAGIEGITKIRVAKLFANHHIELQTTRIYRQQLPQVEAAFVTNSLIGVWPVQELVDCKLDCSESTQIQAWFFEHYQGYL